MTKPTEAPTEYDAMMAAGPEGIPVTAVVLHHCIYRSPPGAKGRNPECAVLSASGVGLNTGCSLPTGTENTCAIARGWQTKIPLTSLFDDIE